MRQVLTSLTFLVVTACAGEKPPGTNNTGEDAGVDAPPTEAHQVSGKTMDYFIGTSLDTATVTVDGIDPPKTTTSIADGTYTIDAVPTGSKVFMTVSRMNYRLTRNLATSVADMPVVQDVYVMSNADVQRQYATDGKLPTAGKAFVVVELQRNDGTPLDAIPLTDVTLVDALDAPVPGVIGPYTFGLQGDITPATLTTELHGGKVRVAFLDVPPGTFTVKASYAGGQGILTAVGQITTIADGATIALAGGMGPGPGPGPMPIVDPTFAAHIHPRLQKAAQGGLACANCHTLGGAGAVLIFDSPAAETLAAMQARLGVIDLVAPANSLLLTKPLYELPPALQNHPNATFADINDEDYKLILLWITNGAKP